MIHTINHPAIGLASAIKNPPGPDTSSNQTPSNGIWSFGWPKALDFLGNHFDALSEPPCGQQYFSAHRKGLQNGSVLVKLMVWNEYRFLSRNSHIQLLRTHSDPTWSSQKNRGYSNLAKGVHQWGYPNSRTVNGKSHL